MTQQKVARYRALLARDAAGPRPRELPGRQSCFGLEGNPCSQPEQSSLGRRASHAVPCSTASPPRCSSSMAMADCHDNAFSLSETAFWQRPVRLLRNDSRSRAMPRQSLGLPRCEWPYRVRASLLPLRSTQSVKRSNVFLWREHSSLFC